MSRALRNVQNSSYFTYAVLSGIGILTGCAMVIGSLRMYKGRNEGEYQRI